MLTSDTDQIGQTTSNVVMQSESCGLGPLRTFQSTVVLVELNNPDSYGFTQIIYLKSIFLLFKQVIGNLIFHQIQGGE